MDKKKQALWSTDEAISMTETDVGPYTSKTAVRKEKMYEAESRGIFNLFTQHISTRSNEEWKKKIYGGHGKNKRKKF